MTGNVLIFLTFQHMYRFIRRLPLILLLAILVPQHTIAQRKNFDYRILRCAEGCRTDPQNSFYRFISHFNNPVCISPSAAMLTGGMINHDEVLKHQGLMGLESIAGGEFLVFTLKKSIGRIRPFRFDTTFTSVLSPSNQAFPSGHTTEAFAMATAVTIASRKWYVAVPAYAWASLIAYARVYLGVHYPTDVIAGAIIGGGSTYLMYRLNKTLHKDPAAHPRNEIVGVLSGLATAYIISKSNQWFSNHRKKRAAMLVPVAP